MKRSTRIRACLYTSLIASIVLVSAAGLQASLFSVAIVAACSVVIPMGLLFSLINWSEKHDWHWIDRNPYRRMCVKCKRWEHQYQYWNGATRWEAHHEGDGSC